jgi:hypothetical protein
MKTLIMTISRKYSKGVDILHSKLSAIVRVVRLGYAILFVMLLAVVYLTILQPWMANWGSTAAEREMTLPGDDLIPQGIGKSTLALTLHAPTEVVWQWLIQVGQDRAGFYTYTWLENLVGADIHNTNEIRPEWQHLAVGDAWRLIPPDYLGGLGKDAASRVLMIDPGRALVVEMFGAHVLEPLDEHTTRLIVRGQSADPNLFQVMVWKPLVFTLERRMLLGLKARAEGRPDAPLVLMAIARTGWSIAGIVVAGLFLSQRRRWFWLTLPILVALPALLMGKDLQAGLAAFLGLGISLLGFLAFGRKWFNSLLLIGPVVLLTLLLAPEAYTAIGLAFALLLLAALGVLLFNRSRVVASTAGLATNPGVQR